MGHNTSQTRRNEDQICETSGFNGISEVGYGTKESVSHKRKEGAETFVEMPQRYKQLSRRRGNFWLFKKSWIHIRSLIPFILLLAFSGIGGLLFSYYEGNNQRQAESEAKAALKLKIAKASTKIAADFFDNGLFYLNATDGFDLINQAVQEHLGRFGEDVGLIKPKDFEEWTFLGSVYFSLSLSTTIGYGNIHPETTVGRVLTILYALVGIPLAIYTLNELGKILLKVIWKTYLWVLLRLLRCGICRSRMVEDMAEFPLTLALLLTLGWMLLCSYLFCMWEDWDYFISFYFFFMSLTTIGLGDVTPKYPSYMIGSFAFIMVGMTMVSMCFNLLELKLQSLVKKTMMHIQTTLHSFDNDLDTSDSPKKVEMIDQLIVESDVMEHEPMGNRKSSIQQIFSNENEGWLHTFLGKESKQVLVEEWERKVAMRNRGVQVSPQTSNQSVECDIVVPRDLDIDQLFTLTYPDYSRHNRRCVPSKEIHVPVTSTRNVNDFYLLTRQLNFILEDCQQILHKEG